MMTATGLKLRRCGFCRPSYQRQVSSFRSLDEGRRKRRPLPLLFVLEEHEHLIPVGRPCRDRLGPTVDVDRHVAFVAQTEIAVPRGRHERSRLVAKVGDAQRRASLTQESIDVFSEPRWVPKLEGRPKVGRQERKKGA